jgi:hypothetical protein
MKKIIVILTVSVFTTLVSCVNSDNYSAPDLSGDCKELTVTKSVQDIATIATSSLQSYNTASANTADVIEAYVTSSDEGGNFYKSISFVSVDGVKGFSVPVDDYNLYTKYPVGTKVFVNLKNRYFYNNTQTASLEIGNLYDNLTPANPADDKVGRIPAVEYQDALVRGCTKVDESTLVNHLTIAAAKNNANINKLVEFDAVQFADESIGKTYYDASLNSIGGATNHILKDANGTSIIVRVSEFATFSSKGIPSGNGKVRGVLTKYNSDYQFMIRTENDVNLTGTRVVPLFEETFTSNFGNWSKQSVSGAQVWSLNTTFGNPGSCALMSGFASSVNNTNEDWLISPAINLAAVTSATLSFDNASRFSGNLIEVLISTNYTAGAPSTATWVPLSGFTLDTNTGSYVWTGSGPLNISSYTGNSNVRVAFKYTSTTTASRTWEIDNVKVVGQ